MKPMFRSCVVGRQVSVVLFLGAFGVLFLLQKSVRAQAGAGTGRIEGTVTDASGSIVPGALVTAREETTSIAASLTTEDNGHFIFLYLAPGSYDISIKKDGFASSEIKHVEVRVGTTSSVQPQLKIGNVSITVSVNADAPLVDATQSALSSVVEKRSIESLPLNGRNFTDFVLLTPGATTDGDFGMVSFNGMAGNFNNYMVDGANNNNAFFEQQIGRTSIPFQFSEDVVQEFQVSSTGYEAEFGQAGGGVVNTVTKSGGNDFHGDGYYYILDSALNANDFINNENGIAKPSNRRQQFGGTLGGPIVHDRLFFLGNYEGQVRNEPITVNDAPALAGLTDPAAFFAANPDLAAQVKAAAGSFPRTFNQNTGFVKASGLLSPRNNFTATYNYQRFRSPHGYFNTPTSTGDGLSLTDGATSHFAQFTVISSISPMFINEFRFHFGNDYHFDLPDTAATAPSIVIQNPDTGFAFGGNRFQLSTSDRRFEFADNLTRILGRHSLRFGVDININQDRDYFLYGPKGEYQFASLADVPAGNFQLYLQSFGQTTASFTSPTYSLFAQDEFHVSRGLNINYGVRYDLQVLPQPPVCNPQFTLTCKIPYSKNNVSPRVGFAYSLDSDSKTVVRGGFGIFYIQEDLLDVSQAFLSNGVSRPFLVTTGPGFGNTSPIVTYPTSLSAFPSGAGSNPSLVVFAPNFRSPYVEQGNLALERRLGGHMAVSAGYIYSHGLALLGNSNGVTRQANGNFGLDLNLVPPSLQPAFGGNFSTATVTLPNGTSYVVPEFEAIDGILNPNFGTINAVDNSGKSIYHALLLSWRYTGPQFTGGLAYTVSKTIDQGTGYFNQFDQRNERGPSQLDQPQRFVLNGAWSPTWHPLKNFTFASVVTVASGRPYTAVFDTSSLNFSVVPKEPFNGFRGPGQEVIDLSVARTFKLNERINLKLLAEAFDLFNHPNFQQNNINNIQYTTTQAMDSAGNGLPFWAATANPGFGAPGAMAPRIGSRSFQFSGRISF
jgi:Carboxypeptidase regulatory-like domain/TonB dependent receptor